MTYVSPQMYLRKCEGYGPRNSMTKCERSAVSDDYKVAPSLAFTGPMAHRATKYRLMHSDTYSDALCSHVEWRSSTLGA